VRLEQAEHLRGRGDGLPVKHTGLCLLHPLPDQGEEAVELCQEAVRHAIQRRWGCLGHVLLALNLLALIPLLGGFPKTAAVLRTVHHVGRVVHVGYHRGDRAPRR
jgi:hypothetical protein